MRKSTHKKIQVEKSADFRWRCAVHEAGHCVARELLCGGVVFAEVGERNGTLGKVPDGTDQTAEGTAHTCIAGVAAGEAEGLFFGDIRGVGNEEHGDVAQLVDWLFDAGMAENTIYEVLIDARKDARKLIAAYFPAVESIADVLMAKGRIEGAEVASIVAEQTAKLSEELSTPS